MKAELIWRCSCGYYELRNGGSPPTCRFCFGERVGKKNWTRPHLPMFVSVRVPPPEVKPSIWEDL